jgi:hypothetical protein
MHLAFLTLACILICWKFLQTQPRVVARLVRRPPNATLAFPISRSWKRPPLLRVADFSSKWNPDPCPAAGGHVADQQYDHLLTYDSAGQGSGTCASATNAKRYSSMVNAAKAFVWQATVSSWTIQGLE